MTEPNDHQQVTLATRTAPTISGEHLARFAELVREQLAKRHWRATHLAREAGVHVNTIYNILGTDHPAVEETTARQVLEALGYPPEALAALRRGTIPQPIDHADVNPAGVLWELSQAVLRLQRQEEHRTEERRRLHDEIQLLHDELDLLRDEVRQLRDGPHEPATTTPGAPATPPRTRRTTPR